MPCHVVSYRGVAFISKGDAVLVIGGEDGSGTPMSTVEVSENSPQSIASFWSTREGTAGVHLPPPIKGAGHPRGVLSNR